MVATDAERPLADGFSPSDLPRRLGRYTLLRRIAKGGMGEVLLAATLGLEGAERPVIIKMIRAEHRTDASFKARFLDEARVQAQLSHSGVAQVIEATTDDATGEPYVAVEYIDGRSLGDVRHRSLSSGQRLPWHEAIAIATLAAEALAHMHERVDASSGEPLKIVHRDLSPQNIMMSYTGELKVIDFGTARGQNRRCHTVAGVVFAKPGYVAPEVANGDPGDYRVDLYALGVMLWELVKGTRFLAGDAADHMALVAKNERNLPPVAAEVDAPVELDAILQKLTAFERADRYEETRFAARDLAGLLSNAPALPGGERGVRARSCALMQRLFPGDAARARREFTKLVAGARKLLASAPTPAAEVPIAVTRFEADEAEGLLPGTRYRIVREIGEGASSTVYEAVHVDLGRRVALKVARAPVADTMDRFRREGRALALARGPFVVDLVDVGRSADDRPFSVMSLAEGETLDRMLARGEPMAWREALGIALKTVTALAGVHAAGVVHRDIKPENLLVTPEGDIKILDFGIALVRSPDMSDLDTPPPQKPGLEIFGTPEYMAPEQVCLRKADERSDIYAVGSVLYELLTGRLPFVETGVAQLLEAKAQGNPESPRRRVESRGIPESVDEICMRALARHPSLRFQTADEMRGEIEAALAEPQIRRQKRRIAGFGALAGVMTFAGVLLAAAWGQLGPRAEGFVSASRAKLGSMTTRASDAPIAPVAETAGDAAAGEAAVETEPPVAPDASTTEGQNAAEELAPNAHPSPETLTSAAPPQPERAEAEQAPSDDTTKTAHKPGDRKSRTHTAQKKKGKKHKAKQRADE